MRRAQFNPASLPVALAVTLAAGCAQKEMTFLTPPEPPIVWPEPPDEPRVRFVGELKSSEDLGMRKTFAEGWNELLYGPKPPQVLVSPHAVAVHPDGARVAVADTNAACVHLFDVVARTYAPLVAVGGDGGQRSRPPEEGRGDAGTRGRGERENGGQDALPPKGAALACPVAVTWVGEALWVADSMVAGIAVFARGGIGRWIDCDEIQRPAGMVYCPANELCYVCDSGAHQVLAFDTGGRLVLRFGSRGSGPGQFNFPSHIACGPEDTLLVTDSLNFRVQRLGLDGTPIGSFGRKGDAAGDLSLPKGVAAGPDGTIWVVDANYENIQAFTPEGQLLMAFGEEGQGPGQFWLPAGLCLDTQRRMWVADTYNRRVQVFQLLQ